MIYEYTIDAEGTFGSRKFNRKRFRRELESSTTPEIANNVVGVEEVDGNCRIELSAALNGKGVLALEQLVRNHDGTPLPSKDYAELVSDAETSGPGFQDMLTAAIFTDGRELLTIHASASGDHSSQTTSAFRILLDGEVQRGFAYQVGDGLPGSGNITLRRPVNRGRHVVKLQWRNGRIEIPRGHASLLVEVTS